MKCICKIAVFFLLITLTFQQGISMAGSVYYTESDLAIPPIYKSALPFSEDLAVVGDDSGMFFITLEGKRAFNKRFSDLVFEEASSFCDGLAAVRVKGQIGYINKQGKMLIQPQFEEGKGFKNGKALVWTERGGPWAFIDTQGKIIVSFDKSYSFPGHGPDFIDDRAVFYQRVGMGNQYGFLNENGEQVIPLSYQDARPFSEGLAAVQIDTTATDAWKDSWSFIDREGNIAMDRRFYGVSQFKDGLASVDIYTSEGSREEYINTRGETVFVVPEEGKGNVFRYGNEFEIMVCIEHNQCGFKDQTGNWIIDPHFPPLGAFHDGLAVFTASYRSENDFALRGKNVTIKTVGCGVINRQGEIVVEKGKYNSIGPYEHGLARVDDDPVLTPRYIDSSGNLVDPVFLPIGEPSQGLQLVWSNRDNKKGGYGYCFVKER